jgi:hypothetical protein
LMQVNPHEAGYGGRVRTEACGLTGN